MEKRLTIGLIIVLAILLIVVGVNFTNQSTGQATLTSGASYGKISRDGNNYINCVYISENDGWDVIKKGTVQYTDKKTGQVVSISDSCEDEKTVKEFDCSGKYRERRNVGCPAGQKCSDGACVS